ncbi:MAG: T9SS type A sorting domain-containing protein [Bacteroidota bacterium]
MQDNALLTATNQFGYTFQWKKNNINISGATFDTLRVTTAGKYKVLVSNAFFCTKTSKVDTVIVPCREGMAGEISALEDEAASDLKIYPNPATDYLEFRMTSVAEKSVLEIFNLMGSEIMSKNISSDDNGNYSEILDISHLPSGIYIFKVINETGQQFKKFVKE